MSECLYEREGVVAVFRGEERVSVHLGAGAVTVNVEWSFRSKSLRAGVSATDEGVLLSLGVPPAALYVGVEGDVMYRLMRRYGRGLMDKAIEAYVTVDGGGVDSLFAHWNLGTSTSGWDSKTPAWRNGGFFPVQTVFGRMKHSKRVVETRPVTFHMPEGDVTATAELYESTWTMPRWPGPWCQMYRVEVDVPKGLDDGHRKGPTFGVTQPARSIGEAVGKMLGDVLRNRGVCGGATIGERAAVTR